MASLKTSVSRLLCRGLMLVVFVFVLTVALDAGISWGAFVSIFTFLACVTFIVCLRETAESTLGFDGADAARLASVPTRRLLLAIGIQIGFLATATVIASVLKLPARLSVPLLIGAGAAVQQYVRSRLSHAVPIAPTPVALPVGNWNSGCEETARPAAIDLKQ